ncbi:hypothetical protein [Acinetobacter baumannii]|uniref:hypothetical protein n=1 Tax=Acinetobacter baumannii TaxID=470 RepID=UPI0025A197C0|nr:hypothetical protein [Acinetobacter baumannii]
MNLKQWQRSKKIKAEAEAAAKRTVERVLNAVKEPAMSEFKVGDKVVLKSSSQNKVMTIQEIYKEFIRAYWDKEHYSFAHKVNFRFAEDEEIAAGHRIESSNDQAISDCSVSNLCQNDTQNSLPIKQENQDMGDDFPIENRISPNCEVKNQ